MAGSVRDLPAPWRDEPYLVMCHGRSTVAVAWHDDDALVVLLEGSGRDPGVIGVGDADAVGRLLDGAVTALGPARWATLPRGSWEAAADGTRAAFPGWEAANSWDCMWTDRPLVGISDHAVERLPAGVERVDAEIAEALDRAHPTASTRPGDPRLEGWWAVREEGRLVAVVGAIRFAPGLAPHLVSLGVDPAHRGRGLAGAVLAAAVSDGLLAPTLVGPPMVGLGLYAANDVARQVYVRHGFVLGHRFDSRPAHRD
ncbi:GNAT family N-acetyltransferase [Actinotalea fermentans]|uniref:N-acetyltransferase domain-containing protein n=1 Tax=Actinotalea fermentans TaxID=43671 RepID=A0A511YUG3_9CELL|nr:GNAT family N-acetyltransferase [Actinotalea fermentans]KGM15752.1 hypothetical protein N867_05900 [Actinotalea fermentans ATCC 43279 = JCM 9966 = DSM 3133]GEN78834.1 hypothetical protein AFE02nite_05680 [Actinotalea fermentans]